MVDWLRNVGSGKAGAAGVQFGRPGEKRRLALHYGAAAGTDVLLEIDGRYLMLPEGSDWIAGVEVLQRDEWVPLHVKIGSTTCYEAPPPRSTWGTRSKLVRVWFRQPTSYEVVDWSCVRDWSMRIAPTASIAQAEVHGAIPSELLPEDSGIPCLPPLLSARRCQWRGANAALWVAQDLTEREPCEVLVLELDDASAERLMHRQAIFTRQPPSGSAAVIGAWRQPGRVILGSAPAATSGNLQDACDRGELDGDQLLCAMRQIAGTLDQLDAIGLWHGQVDPRLVGWQDETAALAFAGLPFSVGLSADNDGLRPPESMADVEGSARADQFMLAMLYIGLRSGNRPAHWQEVMQWSDGGPPGLDRYGLCGAERIVLSRALSPNPAHRWSSSSDLVTALRLAVGALPPWERDRISDPPPRPVGSLSLPEYRALFLDHPRPSPEQVWDFVEYVAHKHSWYKHLSLMPPGVRFTLFLDPGAGMQRVTGADGRQYYRDIEDDSSLFHHAMMPTSRWRARFGFLNVMDRGAPSFEVLSAAETAHYEIPLGVLADGKLFAIPTEIAFAGAVQVTGVVHDFGSDPRNWEWFFHHVPGDDLRRHLRWPEASGGPAVVEALHCLLEHGDSARFRFRGVFERLVAPERTRQRELMYRQAMRMIALVYGE